MVEKYLALAAIIAVIARETYHFYVKRALTKEVERLGDGLIEEKIKNIATDSQKAKEEYEKAKSDYDSSNKS